MWETNDKVIEIVRVSIIIHKFQNCFWLKLVESGKISTEQKLAWALIFNKTS